MRLTVSDKKQKMLVAAFFIILTVLGLWMGTSYGVPWDERDEQKILVSNLYEYAEQLLGEDSAVVQLAKEMGAYSIADSIERDHGIAPFYPLAPIFFIQDGHTATQIWHGYIWLLFMLGVFSLYILVRELGASRLVACASVLLLYLSPRFFAEGHYNNKDIVLLSLVLCIFALAAVLMRKRSFMIALLFSLAGAFATNIKIIGIFAWGLAGLAVLIRWLQEKKPSGNDIRVIAAAFLSFAVFYFLITPAMWSDPIAYFRYIISNTSHFSRWIGVVFFDGAFYKPAQGIPLPWYYLPKTILITVPVFYLLLAAAGQVYAIRLCCKRDKNRPLLIALSLFWILPLVAAMVTKPVIYNGWRHFYFVYAGIAALGGVGLMGLYRLVCLKQKIKVAVMLAVALLFTAQATSIVVNHPYQYAYYNVLAGQVEGKYELDYWALSNYNAMSQLVNSTTRNKDLPLVCSRPPTPPHIYPMTNNYLALPENERDALVYTDDYETAPYLIYNTNYAMMAGLGKPDGYHELFSISGYGHVIVIVYEKTLTD